MLFARVTLINVDRRAQFGEYKEQVPSGQTRAQIYKEYRKLYGRCSGKLYHDPGVGQTTTVWSGWVFVKRCRYEDSAGSYLQEVWVSLEEHQPADLEKVA